MIFRFNLQTPYGDVDCIASSVELEAKTDTVKLDLINKENTMLAVMAHKACYENQGIKSYIEEYLNERRQVLSDRSRGQMSSLAPFSIVLT